MYLLEILGRGINLKGGKANPPHFFSITARTNDTFSWCSLRHSEEFTEQVESKHSVGDLSVAGKLIDPLHQLGVVLVREQRQKLTNNLSKQK